MATSTDKLLEMGLSVREELTDEPLRFGHWPRKGRIQTSIKGSDTNLAACESLWRTTSTTPANNQVCCRMPVHIAKVSAVVTAGGEDGKTDRNLPEKLYLCKEETATWTKQHLKYATESNQHKADLKITVPETSYSFSKYGEYVPKVVRDASDKYITKFFNHHTGAHPKLTKEKVDNLQSTTISRTFMALREESKPSQKCK